MLLHRKRSLVCWLSLILATTGMSFVPLGSREEVMASHYTGCGGAIDCNGTARWVGGMDGADAKIYTSTMSMAGSNPSWHVNNVLWVRDQSGVTDCSVGGISIDTAWVEVGYQARPGQPWPHYFYWGDCRAGASIFEQWLGEVKPADKYRYNYFKIARSSQGSSVWRVTIDAATFDRVLLSASNVMYPDLIEIGLELTGNHGGYSGTAYFTENRWIWVLSSGEQSTYQVTAGNLFQTPPVQSSWNIIPAPGGTGGKWRTFCPC